MKNPWLAKNPLLSMWMSGANTVFGAARGHALNAARRQQTATANAATRAVIDFWSGAAFSPKRAKRRAK